MLGYKDILKIPSQSPPNVSQSHFISSFNDYSARCTWSKNAKTRCSFLSNNVRESESNCLVERSKKKEQTRLGLKLYYSTIYELREKKGKLKVQQLYTYVAYGETSALKLDFKKDNERLKKNTQKILGFLKSWYHFWLPLLIACLLKKYQSKSTSPILKTPSHRFPRCSSPVIRGSRAAIRMSRVKRCKRETREERAASILVVAAPHRSKWIHFIADPQTMKNHLLCSTRFLVCHPVLKDKGKKDLNGWGNISHQGRKGSLLTAINFHPRDEKSNSHAPKVQKSGDAFITAGNEVGT